MSPSASLGGFSRRRRILDVDGLEAFFSFRFLARNFDWNGETKRGGSQ